MISLKTTSKVEHRSLSTAQLRHLHFLLQPYWTPIDYDGDLPEWMEQDYNSYIIFAYKDPTAIENPFHGYAGTMKSDDSDSGFNVFYEPVPAVDLYCCPNGFRTWNKRSKDTLIALQNIVVDLDAHNCDLTISELQEHIRKVVPKIVEKSIVKPNFISYTGRGVHFWFCIEPCHASLLVNVNACVAGLISLFKSLLSELEEEVLSLDEGACKRVSGLYRVPYSYNNKASTWGDGELIHYNRPHIDVLNGILRDSGYLDFPTFTCGDADKAKPKKENKEKSKKKKRKTKYKYIVGYRYKDSGLYKGCFMHRKRFIEHLLNTREKVEGSREILLFALYHALYNLFELEYANHYIKTVNASLDNPLPDQELEDYVMKSIHRRNYKFTNKSFLEFVSATPEEVQYFNKSTIKKEKKAAAQKKKLDRDNKIYELWDSGCTNISEIARAAGCSRDTVRRVVSCVRF